MARLAVAIALVLLVLTGGAQAGRVVFADAVGDQVPGRPDVTTVAVSDTARGMVTLDVAVTGSIVAAGSEVDVFIDLDKAADRTDRVSPFDAEFLAYWRPGEGGGDYDLMRWNTSWGGWKSVMSDTLEVTASADHYVFTFHRTDLGDASGFSFLVLVPTADVAPSIGKWIYNLGPDVVIPAIGRPAATPAAPVAGQRFSVWFPLTRAETALPLRGGTVTATPSIRGRVLPHSERIVDSEARVTLRVPKTAKGRTLRIALVVRIGRETARTVVGFRVR